MIKRFVDYIGDPKNAGKLKILLYITLAVVFLADFLAPREHIVFPWDSIPGWSAVYGFVACIVLIIFSKFLGHAWLMKKEDYYD